MARQILMMVWYVLMLGLLSPADSAQLRINPSVLSRNTTLLTIDCIFAYGRNTEISNVVNLMISRSDVRKYILPNFTDLASINEFTPNQAKIITPFNQTSIRGQIMAKGAPYLRLQWRNPTDELTGIYRCSVLGLDEFGRSVRELDYKRLKNVSKGTGISAEDLHKINEELDKIVVSLYNLTSRQDAIEQKIERVSNYVFKLMTNVSKLFEEIRRLDREMGELNRKVLKLTDGFGKLSIQFKTINRTIIALSKAAGQGPGGTPPGLTGSNIDIYREMTKILFIRSADYKRKHYKMSKEQPDTVEQAQVSCLLQGGYLAEINDADEHNFIKNFLVTMSPREKYWALLGAKNTRSSWRFLHSKKGADYTDWAPGYPDAKRPTCMFLKRLEGWKMANADCAHQTYYITFVCEIQNK